MGLTIAQKIIRDHLISGDMTVGLNNECIFTHQRALCDFSTFVTLMREKVISS